MSSYKTMYYHLFNAITDALIKLKTQDYYGAEHTLITAQQWGEDAFIDMSEEEM